MAAPDPESTTQPATTPAPAAPDAGGPPAPELAAGSSAEAIRLVVKAVGMLPEAERDQVYGWLVTRGLAGPPGSGRLLDRRREVSSQLLSLQSAGGLPDAQQTGQQVVPVRFAADQHAQLRTWCTDHGFSMATVVRGLVARFLEGQLPARS